ncbi:Nif3-like dinuclear metal center hexameric protein [Marinospirillum sp. MEB164]|uniref:Nif3-like dinuclear metal center hexameric protein n=1 Tax=Marinospirillum alkalitolerans TaxID=3123374 RepID=A0ABW8PXE7_9GAMM
MSIALTQLVQQINAWLNVEQFQDYCPNGLQVEGRDRVRRVVTGVTASQALIDRAVATQADAILVHHGYFWKGEAAPLIGYKGRRIKSLMQADISLLAYHLPLDEHPLWGNNQQLAIIMGWEVEGSMAGESWQYGLHGCLPTPLSAQQFADRLAQRLGQPPLHLAGHQRPLKRIAWCTGAAHAGLVRAAELGVDAYVTGEASEQSLHLARELGVDFFAAGHHATERGGVQALGQVLAEQLGLEVEFVDLPNPV